MRARTRLAACGILAAITTAPLIADTLVLRDGRRLQGVLIGIRDGIVEFEGRRGFAGRERVRLDRSEVVRIELDDRGDDRDGRFGADRSRDWGRDNDGGDSRAGGQREREVVVSASELWTDTGLTVRAGQTVRFAPAGRVRWGPGRQDGPAGEDDSPRNAGRPLPNRPAAALIGRIGDRNDPFFIGDGSGPIRVRESGPLYLGINDDFLQDNSGAFRVTVFY